MSLPLYHLHLPGNVAGRDFIVGDLHGSIDLLMGKLAAVSFDPAVDRLFSVGDLCDRGLRSLDTLKLLLEPWFFAVQGNHEAMLLTWLGLRSSFEYSPATFIRNGGDWVYELSDDEMDYLCRVIAPRVQALPLVLTVADAQQPFHVAHAELLKHGPGLPLLTDDELTDALIEELSFPLTWGRRLVKDALNDLYIRGKLDLDTVQCSLPRCEDIAVTDLPFEPGLSLTYVGHSILPFALLHRSHAFIDRGAYQKSAESELFVVEHGRLVEALRRETDSDQRADAGAALLKAPDDR